MGNSFLFNICSCSVDIWSISLGVVILYGVHFVASSSQQILTRFALFFRETDFMWRICFDLSAWRPYFLEAKKVSRQWENANNKRRKRNTRKVKKKTTASVTLICCLKILSVLELYVRIIFWNIYVLSSSKQ